MRRNSKGKPLLDPVPLRKSCNQSWIKPLCTYLIFESHFVKTNKRIKKITLNA